MAYPLLIPSPIQVPSGFITDNAYWAEDADYSAFQVYYKKHCAGELRLADIPMIGTVAGFITGGYSGSTQIAIDRYTFNNDLYSTTVSDWGDLPAYTNTVINGSSNLAGYAYIPSGRFSKIPFASANAQTEIYGPGSLGSFRYASVSTEEEMYVSAASGYMFKIPFITEGETSVAPAPSTPSSEYYDGAASTASHGYIMGGIRATSPLTPTNQVFRRLKFSFASEFDLAHAGDLNPAYGVHGMGITGHSSATDGWTTGGYDGTYRTNVIDKFPFANSDTGTSGGYALSSERAYASGTSSPTAGYVAGGYISVPAGRSDDIEKFRFSDGYRSTTTGNLSVGRSSYGGIQD